MLDVEVLGVELRQFEADGLSRRAVNCTESYALPDVSAPGT